PSVERLLNLEDAEHALGRDEELGVLLEEQRAEVAVVDDHVDLRAALAVGIDHEAGGDLVAGGEEQAEPLYPSSLGCPSFLAGVIEGLAASLEVEVKLFLLAEKEGAEVDLPWPVGVVGVTHGSNVPQCPIASRGGS